MELLILELNLQGKRVFVREATGLVREISLFDGLIWSLSASGPIGWALAYTLFYVYISMPGADLVTAILVGIAPTMFIMVCYSFLSSAMPRSGGDYVYLSRLINPALGFAANWNMVVWQCVGIGVYTSWLFTFGLTPALSTMAFIFNNPTLGAWATSIADPTVQFIVGSMIIVIVGAVMSLGTKKMVRTMDIFYIVALVGMLIGIAVIATTTREQFVAAFNSFVGSPNAYNSVIASANQAGLSIPSGYDTVLTFEAIAIVATYWYMWAMWSTYITGEMKRASQPLRHLFTTGGALVINAVIVAIALALLIKAAGYDFLLAATWTWSGFGGTWPISAPAVPATFISMINTNPLIVTVVSLSFALWGIPFLIILIGMVTRSIFAWSFDRLAPVRLADISERFHSPVYATAVVCAAGIASLYLNVYTKYVFVAFTMAVIGPLLFSFVPVGIASIIFPYTKRQVYNQSPLKRYKIAGVPLISVAGVVATAYMIWMLYVLFKYPALGGSSPQAALIMVGIWIIGIVLFYLGKYYRKRQGINLDLVYKEIPPE